MKTWITDLRTKAAVTGLVVGLAFGGSLVGAMAHHADADNYFAWQPGPAGGRTGIDPHDPYAPVDLSGAGMALDGGGNARAEGTEGPTESGWDVPPMPGLPGRPY